MSILKISLALIFISISGCKYMPTPENKAKQAVADVLIDPDSAKFESISEGAKEGDYCGFVNGKNRVGAYAGASPFIYQSASGKVSSIRELPTDSDFRSYKAALRVGEDGAEIYWKLHNGCKFPEKYAEVCNKPLPGQSSRFCTYLLNDDMKMLISEMANEFGS